MFIDGLELPDSSQVKTESGAPVNIAGISLPPSSSIVTSDHTAVNIEGIKLPAEKSISTNDTSPVKIDGLQLTSNKSAFMNMPYDIGGSMLSTPDEGAIITRFTSPRQFFIPLNWKDSAANIPSDAQGTSVFTIYRNDIAIGTFTFSLGSKVAVFSNTAALTINSGDVIEVRATTVDGSLMTMNFTLTGNITQSV